MNCIVLFADILTVELCQSKISPNITPSSLCPKNMGTSNGGSGPHGFLHEYVPLHIYHIISWYQKGHKSQVTGVYSLFCFFVSYSRGVASLINNNFSRHAANTADDSLTGSHLTGSKQKYKGAFLFWIRGYYEFGYLFSVFRIRDFMDIQINLNAWKITFLVTWFFPSN